MTRRKPTSSRRAESAAVLAAPRTLRWTERAVADLEEIGDFIARDKPRAAERWVQELVRVAERAALVPFSGRRVPELARDDIRELRRRSYRVVYRVTDTRVEVLTVFEGHRLFPDQVAVNEPED